jgi:YVTN family beta-propeller protein
LFSRPAALLKSNRSGDVFTLLVTSFGVAMALWSAPAKALNAYIPNTEGNTVSVIDTATNAVTATITVGFTPAGVAVSPKGGRVYVTNENSNSVSVIDTKTNKVRKTITGFNLPLGLAVTPNGKELYVANVNDSTVSVIDTATLSVSTISGFDQPTAFGVFIKP